MDAEFLQALLATFKVELDEKLQVITDCLLALKKNKKRAAAQALIEEIFRAIHNIKGSAQSIGIQQISDIAHEIESLFASHQSKSAQFSEASMKHCLSAVDAMRLSLESYLENREVSRDALFHPLKANQTFKDSRRSLPLALRENDSIRVFLPQIERLSILSEALQVTQMALQETIDPKLVKKNVHELSIISKALEDEVRQLRLIPLSTLLRPLTRMVHELSAQLNKKVEFLLSGDQIKIDSLILEGLKDPLIHLLRNALDHGIESPDVRKKRGKPPVGTVRLDVQDEGKQIFIQVSDDGAGIDYQAIRRIALEKKIINQKDLDAMDEASLAQLIFQPNFSSRGRVSDISGRGIGLDVVKANIADLKGKVGFKSERHKGSCFELRIPLRLSSDRGLIVKSTERFVIPLWAIEQVLVVHEKPSSVFFLSDLLNGAHGPMRSDGLQNMPIIILKKGSSSIAIAVEEIIGERDIMIKPLNPPLSHVVGVYGGTLLGNGDLIIVLNPIELIQIAQKLSPIKSTILLVEDSLSTASLFKTILENHYELILAKDGKEAWKVLQVAQVHLVITDLEMPKMDGFQLMTFMKKNEKLAKVPVIIVSSLINQEQKKRAIELGANAYVAKSAFQSTELLRLVRQFIV